LSAADNTKADLSLMDLFRIEAENHSRVLETDLVKVEADPTPARIEPLMRAAHSLKGAARIVGLNHGVTLAHAMEDLLSAAQRGQHRLTAEEIDLLLRGNDIFKRLAASEPAAIPDLLEQAAGAIQELSRSLRAVLEPGKTGAAPAPAPAAAPAPAPAPEPAAADANFVRVQSESLNRLMGLAGECLVQTKSLPAVAKLLLRIKSAQQDVLAALEKIVQAQLAEGSAEEMRRQLNEALGQSIQAIVLVAQQLEQLAVYAQRMEYISNRLYDEVIASRMRPFADGVVGFPRMVRDLARQQGKQVNFRIEGANTRVDRDILELLEAPLTHILRNAVDHGLEAPADRRRAGKPAEGALVLEARHGAGLLQISVKDDGRGIDPEAVRKKVVEKGYVTAEIAAKLTQAELVEFLFLPGFSTAAQVTEISGRGVGLDVVQSVLNRVGGAVRVESQPGAGTSFYLQLPLTLSVLRALLLEIAGEVYALPLARVDRLLHLAATDLQALEDRQFCLVDQEPVGIIQARQVLQFAGAENPPARLAIAVISDRLNRYGLVVDRFIGQRELVVLPLDPRLGKVPNVSAGAVMEDGTPILILDVDDLVRSIANLLTHGKLARVGTGAQGPAAARKHVLVVDDSLTVREVERQLLEHRGYEVSVAVDGMDGWNMLQTGKADLVISDIDMPRMNGIELVRRIKQSPRLAPVPVMIVSYKDRPEDRQAGLEAGANYYLTKSSFHDETLLNVVRDLIGEP
jgi:two-component system sensor histidine kinase and response regulator WspE